MSDAEYDQMIKGLAAEPVRDWVVCRSKEEALALLMWMEDQGVLDDE